MYPISLVVVDWRDLNRNLSMVAVKTRVWVQVEMGQEVGGEGLDERNGSFLVYLFSFSRR